MAQYLYKFHVLHCRKCTETNCQQMSSVRFQTKYHVLHIAEMFFFTYVIQPVST